MAESLPLLKRPNTSGFLFRIETKGLLEFRPLSAGLA